MRYTTRHMEEEETKPKMWARYKDGKTRRIMYDNGRPFSDPLKANITSLHNRILAKKASMLVIDGGVGEGKTTLAVEAADEYQGSPIDLAKQKAIGGNDFQRKLNICVKEKLPVIIYDEAGDYNKRSALTKFNRQLNRVFETFRAFQILVIIVLPNFNVLDNALFDKQIPRMLLHCERRTRSYGTFRAYSLYRMFYIKKKMTKLTVSAQAYSSTTPNFYGQFLDLPPKRSNELELSSMKGKKDVIAKGAMANRGYQTVKQVAHSLGVSVEYVNKRVKQLDLSPVETMGRTRYFTSSLKDMIRNGMSAELAERNK